MRISKSEIFPTTIVSVDVSDFITKQDQQDLIREIDAMCQKPELLHLNDLAPLVQSKPFVFGHDQSAVWLKLRRSFQMACEAYVKNTAQFVTNQEELFFTTCRAWFYKSNSDDQKKSGQPWHNHNPSFLSGAFYLKIPSDAEPAGTEFLDPRHPSAHRNKTYEIVPLELTWTIFPGWLNHRAGVITSKDYRYVIAADSYVGLGS